MSLTPFADGVAKEMGDAAPPLFIAFSRYLAAGLLAVGLAFALGRPVRVARADWPGQIARTALLMGAMSALIVALGRAPMADVVGGFFVAPLVASGLSVALFGERLGPARTAGMAAGVAGAAIMLRPEGAGGLGVALALGAGVMFGAYLAATRAAASGGCDLSTLAVQSLLGAAMLAPFALWGGAPEISPRLAGGAGLMGAVSAACHFLTIAAYRRAEATTLAPVMYANLVTTAAVGFLWFGESPGAATLLGAAIIASGGLATVFEARVDAAFAALLSRSNREPPQRLAHS